MSERILRDRIRVVEMEYRGTFGVKFKAKIEGIVVALSRREEGIVETALERLAKVGATAETPTWEIAVLLKRQNNGEIP